MLDLNGSPFPVKTPKKMSPTAFVCMYLPSMLSWVAVVLGRRQESCKRVVDETIALVCADAEMSRENRKSGERRAVTDVIEDAKGFVRGDCHSRYGSLHLSGDEDFRLDRKAAMLVVGKPPYGEPGVACFRIAFAVNIEHVAGMRLCGAPHSRTYVSDEDMWRRDRSPGNSAAMVRSAAT